MAGSLHVVGIVGSLREGSHTRKVVQLALEGAAAEGASTSLVDLRAFQLPLQDASEAVDAHPEVRRLRAAVQPAAGIVLGTPEYHGGYSGVLKNALDLMGFKEFEGKMLGLVGVGGGGLGAAGALHDLRAVGRSLHAWVVPHEASIPRAGRAFDVQGNLLDPALAERAREVGRQVARFSHLHGSEEWRAFLLAWQQAPENPGAAKRSQ